MKILLNSQNLGQDNIHEYDNEYKTLNFSNLIPIGKSGIHIKEKNKGSFTTYCGGKVTNECIQRAKNSSNPKIRKKAIFAQNARRWKHQFGGTIIPGISQNISELFVDIPASKFVPQDNNDYLFDDYYESPITTSYESSTSNPTTEEPTAVADWENFIYRGNVSRLSAELQNALNKHLGKNGKWGNYDCSDFVNKVLTDAGKKSSGTSRDIYSNTTKIDIFQVKPGDLAFLKGTQTDRGIPADKASHVGIIVNTDRINEGIIEVAQGSPGTKTRVIEWNLNKPYYQQHFLGFTRKMQLGGNIPYVDVEPFSRKPINNMYSAFEFEDEPPVYEQQKKEKDYIPQEWGAYVNPQKVTTKTEVISNSKGYNIFKSCWDEYVKENPDAAKYEKVLTKIAKHESNFNYSIKNTSGAPAYGWFQFWQDGKTNNISKYSGLDVESFLQNPMAQIDAAVKMARSIEKQFNSQDLKLAKAQSYSMDQLIRGAWLGGVGGVRKVLKGQGNPSDSKWYKNNKGRTVKQTMQE